MEHIYVSRSNYVFKNRFYMIFVEFLEFGRLGVGRSEYRPEQKTKVRYNLNLIPKLRYQMMQSQSPYLGTNIKTSNRDETILLEAQTPRGLRH